MLSLFLYAIPSPVVNNLTGSGQPEFFSAIVKLISALAIVIGILMLGGYLVKKYAGGMGFSGNKQLIKIISSTYIGTKKNLLLVEVMGEIFLLGVTSGEISMLARFGSENPFAGEAAHEGKGFLETLKNAVSSQNKTDINGEGK